MKYTVTAEVDANSVAEAIAKFSGAAASVKPETTKDAAAPAKPPAAPAPAKPPAVPAPAPAPAAVTESNGTMTLTEVRAILTPLMTGANVPLKPVITQLINTYAGQLSAVDPKQFPDLVAKAQALGAEFDNTGVVPSLS